MRVFYRIVANSFIATSTVNLIWFALSLWVYTQTNSVLATSIMSGIYMVVVALTGMWFGSLVDHHKKKTMMIISSCISLLAFILAFIFYVTAPSEVFTVHSSIHLWTLVALIFVGVIVGNIRMIALPTLTSILVPEERRDKANGLVGTINGVSFLIASIVSGFLLAKSGLYWILLISIALLALAIIDLFFVKINEEIAAHTDEHELNGKKDDIFQTLLVVKKIPGLLGLIFFTSFNNFLGGVFMPLMDPYGLSLVSLQVWGTLWGIISLGFIFGGLFIAKKGLGANPLRTLFRTNIILWTICIFFTIQPSIVLVSVGLFFYLCLAPFVEASEQTIIQKIVPKSRQGRVFGFAQSIESAASPLTAFVIGPIAQFFFIPFMTTGKGVELIGGWFGTGDGRGIALVFILAGSIGLLVTLLAMRSKSYKYLSQNYTSSK